MKISEFIRVLEKVKRECGDIDFELPSGAPPKFIDVEDSHGRVRRIWGDSFMEASSRTEHEERMRRIHAQISSGARLSALDGV